MLKSYIFKAIIASNAYLLVVFSLCSHIAAEPEITTKRSEYSGNPPFRLFGHIENVKTNGIDRRIVKFIAVDNFGQVCFLAQSSSGATRSFIRLTEKFTSGYNIVIKNTKTVNDVGIISFNFYDCSYGSSLSIVGKNGDLKRFSDLPQGIAPSVIDDGKSYMIIGVVDKFINLPITHEELVKFENIDHARMLVNQNKIRFSIPASFSHAVQSSTSGLSR